MTTSVQYAWTDISVWQAWAIQFCHLGLVIRKYTQALDGVQSCRHVLLIHTDHKQAIAAVTCADACAAGTN